MFIYCCTQLCAQPFFTPQFTVELGGLCQSSKIETSSKQTSSAFSAGLGAIFNLNYYFSSHQAIVSGARFRRYNPTIKANTITGAQFFHTHILNALSIPLAYKVEKELSRSLIGYASLGAEMTFPVHTVGFDLDIPNNYSIITYPPPKYNLGMIADIGIKYPIGTSSLILSTTINLSLKDKCIAQFSHYNENNTYSSEVLYNYGYFSINLLYSFNVSNIMHYRC